MGAIFIDGNEAVARAAMAAGCNFFAGYPITPATSIFHHMLDFLPPSDGICLQGEDEIASIGFCLGAAAGGARVMTATSGPGISLFSEQISFAIGAEIPIVIVDVQRLGPSTGSATKGADGDIQFLRWGNSGGLPVIVLSPENVQEAFVLTVKAFDLAQHYRCPVFIASNKELAMTRESIEMDTILVNDASLPSVSYAEEQLFRITSSTHGRDNYITTDPKVIAEGLDGLANKLLTVTEDLPPIEFFGDKKDKILVVAYGVTARAAREAVKQLRGDGYRVSLLVVKTLFPVPEKAIASAMEGKDKVVVIEMNLGQYVQEIRRVATTVPVHFFGQMNGELISPETIAHEVIK